MEKYFIEFTVLYRRSDFAISDVDCSFSKTFKEIFEFKMPDNVNDLRFLIEKHRDKFWLLLDESHQFIMVTEVLSIVKL